MAIKRSPGRPPIFVNGTSRTRVWLKIQRHEHAKIVNAADGRGLTYREFLRRRLREALKEFLDDEAKD